MPKQSTHAVGATSGYCIARADIVGEQMKYNVGEHFVNIVLLVLMSA